MSRKQQEVDDKVKELGDSVQKLAKDFEWRLEQLEDKLTEEDMAMQVTLESHQEGLKRQVVLMQESFNFLMRRIEYLELPWYKRIFKQNKGE